MNRGCMLKLDGAAFEEPTALSEKLSGNEQSYKHSTGYYFVQLIVFFYTIRGLRTRDHK